MRYYVDLLYRLPFIRRILKWFGNIETAIDELQGREIILDQRMLDKVLDPKEFLVEFVNHSKPGSVLRCRVNNVDVIAPVEFLKRYPHCLIYPTNDNQPYTYSIEGHSLWLCSKLSPCDTAFDVGASYGCITLPMAIKVGAGGQVHAFEPATTTQKYLKRFVKLNNCKNVTIVPTALADKTGTLEFIEYTTENELSWAPDLSRINTGAPNSKWDYKIYQVKTITMDEYVFSLGLAPKAIKFDIEGYEFYALLGARETLAKFKPYLYIETHVDAKTSKPTLEKVAPFLKDLGYQIQTSDRVPSDINNQILLCW